MNGNRPLLVPPSDKYVALPAHEFGTFGVCRFCGKTYSTETYDDYLESFYADVWEHNPNHVPVERDVWEYCSRDACHGGVA